jgi:hypothetical protein
MHRPDLGSNAFGESGIVISPPNKPLHHEAAPGSLLT